MFAAMAFLVYQRRLLNYFALSFWALKFGDVLLFPRFLVATAH